MIRAHESRLGRRAGLSLVEMVVAVSIFTVIGFALFQGVEMGRNSNRTVMQVVLSNEAIREARDAVAEEMKIGGDSTVVVNTLLDGNSELTFMHPVVVGGAMSWGVFNPAYGPNPEDQNKENWRIRYAVDSVLEGGNLNRRLIRQILNEAGDIQEQDVVMEGLRRGDVNPPGFSVTKVGDVWVVQVHTTGSTEAGQAQGAVFHVKMRN